MSDELARYLSTWSPGGSAVQDTNEEDMPEDSHREADQTNQSQGNGEPDDPFGIPDSACMETDDQSEENGSESSCEMTTLTDLVQVRPEELHTAFSIADTHSGQGPFTGHVECVTEEPAGSSAQIHARVGSLGPPTAESLGSSTHDTRLCLGKSTGDRPFLCDGCCDPPMSVGVCVESRDPATYEELYACEESPGPEMGQSVTRRRRCSSDSTVACPECESRFADSESLLKHLTWKHHKCRLCPAKFEGINGLTAHLISHTSDDV